METPIRATRRAAEADEWGLVLAAAGIPHRVARDAHRWLVLVPVDEAPRARAALDAYDQDTSSESGAAEPPAASLGVGWATSGAVALSLLGFFAVTGPPAVGARWFERGAAVAGAIVAGEPWRAVTALTLHVDAVHVAGNAVAAAVLLPPVVQRLGPGWGLTLLLLAGTTANLLAALAHDPRHAAVGASTATFGAIGILTALRLHAARRGARERSRGWVVIVAGLLLLAMLGTARGADVLGHALGLATGAGLGLAVAVARPPGPTLQAVLGAVVVVAVVGCWRLAN